MVDLFDSDFIGLWQCLNDFEVKYILVGGVAANLQGYQRYTGDMDLYLKDSAENRQRLRKAYKEYSDIDFEGFETIQFVPGWISFPLNNGMELDIMTSMKGIEQSFDECLEMANRYTINNVTVPVLHLNHLIANKKAVNRPKDQLDVINLEKIQKFRNENSLDTEPTT